MKNAACATKWATCFQVICSILSRVVSGTLAWGKLGVLAVEMEAAALYMNAASARAKRRWLSARFPTAAAGGEVTTAEQRQTAFNDMMQVAPDHRLISRFLEYSFFFRRILAFSMRRE